MRDEGPPIVTPGGPGEDKPEGNGERREESDPEEDGSGEEE